MTEFNDRVLEVLDAVTNEILITREKLDFLVKENSEVKRRLRQLEEHTHTHRVLTGHDKFAPPWTVTCR